jgi:hypothetical protein
MSMPDYNGFDYIHSEPRDEYFGNCETCTDDYGDVCCTVTWTPNGGIPVTTTGPHLDGHRITGEITLNCGIFAALDGLGMEVDPEKREMIWELVNRQLERRPWAVLICAEGTARLELI